MLYVACTRECSSNEVFGRESKPSLKKKMQRSLEALTLEARSEKVQLYTYMMMTTTTTKTTKDLYLQRLFRKSTELQLGLWYIWLNQHKRMSEIYFSLSWVWLGHLFFSFPS